MNLVSVAGICVYVYFLKDYKDKLKFVPGKGQVVLEIRHISEYQKLGILDLELFSHGSDRTKRETEKAATLFTITELLGGSPFELSYTVFNKPFLLGRTEFISISHSHGVLAVLLNAKEETGVDIELCRDKVLQVRHKFLTDEEATFAGEDILKLITLWAAKEAMYKLHGEKALDFRNHISVDPFTGSVLNGRVTKGKRRDFVLKRETIGNHVLVYVLNEV